MFKPIKWLFGQKYFFAAKTLFLGAALCSLGITAQAYGTQACVAQCGQFTGSYDAPRINLRTVLGFGVLEREAFADMKSRCKSGKLMSRIYSDRVYYESEEATIENSCRYNF